MRVRWSDGARFDLREIVEHIAADDPGAAKRVAANIRAAVRALGAAPKIGRMVPEIADEDVRERIVPPYRVLYFLTPKAILVLGVLHSKRDLTAFLKRR